MTRLIKKKNRVTKEKKHLKIRMKTHKNTENRSSEIINLGLISGPDYSTYRASSSQSRWPLTGLWIKIHYSLTGTKTESRKI